MLAETSTVSLELTRDPAAKLPRRWPLPLPITWPRARPVSYIWHDAPHEALTRQGRLVVQAGRLWRLQELWAGPAHIGWAGPGAVLAEARSPAALPGATALLAPFASFAGQQQELTLEWEGAPLTLLLIRGTLIWFAGSTDMVRLIVSGPPHQVQSLGMELARTMAMYPASLPLAAHALALAHGTGWPPPLPDPPRARADAALADTLAGMIQNLVTALLLSMADLDRLADAQTVHRTRVTVRRLRSLLAAYASVLADSETVIIRQLLRDIAGRLAMVRAWDVYLDAPAAKLQAAFPDNAAVERLLQAARRHRQEAHAALRAWGGGPDWRTHAVALAGWVIGQSWRETPETENPPMESGPVAAARLGRWMTRLERFGDIGQVPPDQLHEARKLVKKIRYLIDFNIDNFPSKPTARLLKRLAQLQDALGMVNDAAELRPLLDELGSVGRNWAAGAAAGLAAAEASATLPIAVRAWERLWDVRPFWEKS